MKNKEALIKLQKQGLASLEDSRSELKEAISRDSLIWSEIQSINDGILVKKTKNAVIKDALVSSEQKLSLRLFDVTTDLLLGMNSKSGLIITQAKARILRLILEIKRPV